MDYKKPFLYLLIVISGIFFSSCTLFKKIPPEVKPPMVKVQGGIFTMGDVFGDGNEDAQPTHRVKVEDFYIGRTEITYALYDEFARRTGRELPDDRGYGRGNRAVAYVSWYDAKAYCNYFGYRLPTEPEWEYAARSGGKWKRYSGTNSADSLDQYAITENVDINFPYVVASRKPNDLGLYDMSGNVFEYVGRFYQFYAHPEEWYDLKNNGVRIIRGGSFNEEIRTNRVYWRVGTLDEMLASDVGFRCAVSADEY